MRRAAAGAITLAVAAAASALPVVGAQAMAPANGGPAAVLYDGALNTPPEAQGFVFADLPPGAAVRATAGFSTTLDTTTSPFTNSISAGYTGRPISVTNLYAPTGFSLLFASQVIIEDHAGSDRNGDGRDDRAGFSVIVLGSDARGIELGFWADRVWAQEGGTAALFTQAEGVTFTTTSLITYSLSITAGGYTLAADGLPILAGPLRDYSAFAGFPDPYETPNFVFLGDNTSSARAVIRLAYVAIVRPYVLYLPAISR